MWNSGQIWSQIVALASELLAWTGMLTLAGHEARRVVVHLTEQSPWSELIINSIGRLRNLPAPAT